MKRAADENLPDATANCVRLAHLRLTYVLCSIKNENRQFFLPIIFRRSQHKRRADIYIYND
jgi:hypothetical protein